MTRSNTQKLWWLSAPALVLALSTWCQLHGRALGVEPASFDVSMPWALRSALGWVLAGALLAHFGDKLLTSRLASAHPWRVRTGMAITVPMLTLSSEVLLLSGDTPVAIWLYSRAPLHLAFGGMLFAGYLWIRSRHQTAKPIAEPAIVPLAQVSTEHAPPQAPAVAAQNDAQDAPMLTVEVMTGTGRTSVAIDDIECLEADRNYINVHTPQRSYLLRQTLTSLEKSLRPDTFLRIHRSTIVNRAKIRERRRGGVLVLNSGRMVRVSRAFADRVH